MPNSSLTRLSGFKETDVLLDGLRVVCLAADGPVATAARVLETLGAMVVSDLGDADVVLADDPSLDRSRAPAAVWVCVTPFGSSGPRAGWRATDLGVMAASGNMYATGDPDRPPVRCTMPSGYAHVAPEVAFAALTALASGAPHDVDVSMQEAVLVANMCAPARYASSGFRGVRRGANIGRTREIWPCADGFVSFGLRGGKARVPSLEAITELAGLEPRDWSTFSPNTADRDDLAAIEDAIGRYFLQHTMTELYEIACETNLMLAPICSPREIYASAQLAAREFFDVDGRPARFARVLVCGTRGNPRDPHTKSSLGAWAGTNIVELGSGAAGPIATRYFAEHGATVLRIESRSRPDFLRVYALGPDNPHGLEGSPMYDGLNAGKRGVSLNLKHLDGVALAQRLVVEWADAVAENFAPRAMKGFGLDYGSLAELKPDLVMVSACLNGQTGPHKDYPGFGGQGAALSGYNFLTGWPDREPVGPHGTITDSLAPRFVATALAAGLLHRRRTGLGCYLDVSQVEAAIWTLTPWLLEYHDHGRVIERMGNRSERAVPHGAFPCRGHDRWVAIAVWTDAEWATLAQVIGATGFATLAARQARVDEIEALVGAWTAERNAHEVAEQLQAAGIEAVPVADFGDVHDDPQLRHRDHFVALEHPFMGPSLYERNGFRISESPSGYDRPGPTLGQDDEWVLGDLLGLSTAEQQRLREAGALD
jgi:crotonobetainyl-CoA:carnitine CoA-transferase CaiB-like acyl-CoA transferase